MTNKLELDTYVVTIKKRGANGRFKSGKSISLTELVQATGILSPSVGGEPNWFHKLFRTNAYMDYMMRMSRLQGYHDAILTSNSILLSHAREVKKDAKNKKR